MKTDRVIRKWARHLALSVAVVTMSSVAGTALASKTKCQNQDAKLDVLNGTLLDPSKTPPGYDFCAAAPVTGTLRGTGTTCQRSGTVVPFGDVFGTGDDGYVTTAYLDSFITHDGTLFLHEYNIFDGFNAVSLMKVVGGTGRYAGATGTLTLVSEVNHDNEFQHFRVAGLICTTAH